MRHEWRSGFRIQDLTTKEVGLVTLTKAVITGQSRGLGLGIAEALAAREIPMLAISRTENPSLAARLGRRIVQVQLDLADTDAVISWLETGVMSDFTTGADRVLLVNNAGMLQPIGPLDAQDPTTVGRAVALNVAAPLMLSTAIVVAAPRAERRILHVSSGAARNAYAGWSVYCATKAALDHHARAVALDRSTGVRIASIAPGVIDTDMQNEIRGTSPERFPLRERFRDLKRSGGLSDPGRAGEQLVAYLLGADFGKEPVVDVR